MSVYLAITNIHINLFVMSMIPTRIFTYGALYIYPIHKHIPDSRKVYYARITPRQYKLSYPSVAVKD